MTSAQKALYTQSSHKDFSAFFGNQYPVILAPMAGVTDFPFRQIVQRCGGASLVISEMIASQSMIRSVQKSLQKSCQKDEKTAVQIAGNDPYVMAEAARMCVDHGALLIDINMGCPVKKIAVNSYAGSALMKESGLVQKIFHAVKKAVSVPVTVKMRKGWNEENQNALDIIHIAHAEGLAYITLHGRTRAQLFSGNADWDFIENIAHISPLPVIGNGDITSLDQAVMAQKKAHGIMIGRATYGTPWFIAQVHHLLAHGTPLSEPTFSQKSEIVHAHMESIFAHYGPVQGMGLAKKHLGWYSKGYAEASEFRTRVFHAETMEHMMRHVHAFFPLS